MLPHYPYVLNADCSVKTKVHTWLNIIPFEYAGSPAELNSTASRAERYVQYMAQIDCMHAIIEKLFAAIQASGHWERSIIVIHGDHGSRITRNRLSVSNLDKLVEDDFRDAYSTFFAVKKGASVGRLVASPLSLQSLLARVWQIPVEQSESHHVYLQTADQVDLLATPLLGFDPITSIRIHR